MNNTSEYIPETKEYTDNKKAERKSEKTKERLKLISKYFDIFEVIFIAKIIDYKLIAPIVSVSQKTVERAFNEIRKSPYGKDLIVEIRNGNKIVVFASNSLLRIFGSKSRCGVNNKKITKHMYIGKKKDDALIRVLKHKFKNININNEIKEALLSEEMCEIEDTTTKELKQCKEFLINSTPYQNYKVYNYKFDLLKFNEDITWGDIDFNSEDKIIMVDLFCFSDDIDEIIRTYDKALLILESLKHIDYKNSSDFKIKINYTVITLRSVKINEYIYKFNQTYRYYNLDIMSNWFYDLNLNKIREKKWFFKIYKNTVVGDTRFVLFSDETGKFIEYGNRN